MTALDTSSMNWTGQPHEAGKLPPKRQSSSEQPGPHSLGPEGEALAVHVEVSLHQRLAELPAARLRAVDGYHTSWPAAWPMPAPAPAPAPTCTPGSLTSSKATMGLEARVRILRDGLHAQVRRLEGVYLSEGLLQPEGDRARRALRIQEGPRTETHTTAAHLQGSLLATQ